MATSDEENAEQKNDLFDHFNNLMKDLRCRVSEYLYGFVSNRMSQETNSA